MIAEQFVERMTDRGKRSNRRTLSPVMLYPPQIQHDSTRDQTRTGAVGSRRLPAWATVRPKSNVMICADFIGKVDGEVRMPTFQRYRNYITVQQDRNIWNTRSVEWGRNEDIWNWTSLINISIIIMITDTITWRQSYVNDKGEKYE
jgi:hypothetical protein